MIVFDPTRGVLECPTIGLRNGIVRFLGDGCRADASQRQWTKDGVGAYRSESPEGRLRIEIREETISWGFENTTDRTLHLEGMELVFPPDRQASDWMELIHSRCFSDPSGVKRVGLSGRYLAPNPTSHMVYALQRRSCPEALVFSACPPHAGDFLVFSALHESAHMDGRFGVRIFSEQDRQIPPGGAASSSPLRIRAGEDARDLLEEAGRDWAATRIQPAKPLCRGWNSWDYYAGAVTQQDVLDNLDAARASLGARLEYMVIDEGWEPRWGAWVPNWKFPDGFNSLCNAIRGGGARAGIWSAPLLVNVYTDLYRNHPGWFARDAAGQVVILPLSYGPMALLDPTHPDAANWLSEVFRQLRAAGFDLFKVDFTQEILKARRFHDRTTGRAGLLRRAFTIIREAIGDDAYLLACGAPFESVTGLADSVRVTGDIHNLWGHVAANFSALSARWWMSGTLWNVDADFLLARCEATSADRQFNRERVVRPHDPSNYWMAGRDMNLEEIKTLGLMIYLSGGDVVLGDALPKLNEKGFELIRRILDAPPIHTTARPLDLFDRHERLPSQMLAREDWGSALGLFNWSEDPLEVRFDPVRHGLPGTGEVEEFWSGKPSSYDGEIRRILAPRSAAGLLFRSISK